MKELVPPNKKGHLLVKQLEKKIKKNQELCRKFETKFFINYNSHYSLLDEYLETRNL
jgi:thiamine monophosphate synthase